MSPEAFEELESQQQIALLLAMHIRNELEDFHVDHVPDRHMPQLNSAIRYAIYDFLKRVMDSEKELNYLRLLVPEYWEVPGVDPQPVFPGTRQEYELNRRVATDSQHR